MKYKKNNSSYFILFLTDDNCKTRQLSIESEIQSASIRAKTKKSHSKSQHWLDSSTDMSDSDLDFSGNFSKNREAPPQKFKNAFATYKLATANKMHIGGLSSDSPIPTYNPGLGSSFENAPKIMRLDDTLNSYTVSRDNSHSPTAFTMDLDETPKFLTKTSDTLTMTPAGHFQRYSHNICSEYFI